MESWRVWFLFNQHQRKLKNWFTQAKSQNLTGQNGQSRLAFPKAVDGHTMLAARVTLNTKAMVPRRVRWEPGHLRWPKRIPGFLLFLWDGFFGRRLKKMNPIPSHCFLAIRLMTNCNFFPWWVYKLRCPRSWTRGLHTIGNFKNKWEKNAGPKTSTVVHHF